ncbi:hypothetical protein B0537_02425 [Desulforamulus ferrireducens]|uniref:Transposase TnpC homeodomain domain-containing protein n=1 Tax=Desulforamulus ferrireducens TaxID=1833852 RepID=A0A1S6ITE7_9FIRM|nr:hypothetical protein [Desulforamulus ferrireducens]AQS58051.1 hypothetical protein B0537_02425 [Desulforamulus ferrireducens]
METANNWTEIIAEKDARIAELEMLVKFYEEQFRLSKHRQFGPSSEKGTLSGQLGLFGEAEKEADLQKTESELEEITYARRKRIGKRKDDLSACRWNIHFPKKNESALNAVGCCMKWDMIPGGSL